MQLWIIHATHLFSKINIFHSLNLISVYWINSNNNVVYLFQLKDEILSSYQQIKTLCSQLRQRPRRNSNDSVETSSSSEEVIHSDSLKKGALNSALTELRGLVHDLLRKEAKGACLSCGADSNEKIRMEVQLHKTTEQNEKLERRLKERENLGKQKDDEILDVKSKVGSILSFLLLNITAWILISPYIGERPLMTSHVFGPFLTYLPCPTL